MGPGSTTGDGTFRDLKHTLLTTDLEGASEKDVLVLTSKLFQRPNMFMAWGPFATVLDQKNGLLYTVRTSEYRIEQIDLRQGRIVRVFSRNYPRVDYVVKDFEKEMIKKYDVPSKKYEYDVSRIVLNSNGNLWAFTSARNASKFIILRSLGNSSAASHDDRMVLYFEAIFSLPGTGSMGSSDS
jgi:hypothetical protein